MTIPDAAIEAAAEALVGFFGRERSWAEIDAATTAVEAAMPAIREAIAQEIEAEPLPWWISNLPPRGWRGRYYASGRRNAARTVRGGTP